MNATNEAGAASECIDHGRKGFGIGYVTATVRVRGVVRSTTLHRRIHFEHTGEWPEVVRHTCDNARCINPAHLLSGTQKDNVADMYSRGRNNDPGSPGEANGRCVLSDAQCQEIRESYEKGSRTHGLPALSRRYGVGTSQLWRIIKGGYRK